MIAMPLTQVAHLLGAQLAPAAAAEVSVTGVATDTRLIKSGDLFFALDGANFKGTDFLPEAFRGGACAAVTHNPRDCGGPLVVVEDAGQSLMDFAGALRGSLTIPVVGITGSNGKTTTKDALAAVLGHKFKCVAAVGSYNNRVGLPLTVARVESDTEVLVLEIGTSAPGEIARLSKIAAPSLAVITSIGSSHLEGLGSIEGVLTEKLTITDGMSADGTLLMNVDDERLNGAFALEKDRAYGPTVESYGIHCEADHRAYDPEFGVHGTSFRLSPDGIRLESKLIGEHNLQNLLGVAVCAKKLGMSEAEIATGFATIEPSPMRLEERRINGQRVIFDCYNANPTSMAAAIALVSSSNLDRRSVAILGDMLELGSQSAKLHRDIGSACATSEIDIFLFVGPQMRHAYENCHSTMSNCGWVEGLADARLWMSSHLKPSDFILVKGSRGMGLEKPLGGGA
ncbi:MAG: UDP-N-acetylmuramoyl-tripeptide--D-alanyl-D-alanine ligase [Planctomycetota bacterium]|jgi:UDP-N-acetylmuramoyl-tripeptide--D-alanyl-D-alanine ligase